MIQPTVTNKTILYISFFISFLLNLHRLLILMDLVPVESEKFYPTGIADHIFRLVIIGGYAWSILYFNLIRLQIVFPKISRFYHALIMLIVNGALGTFSFVFFLIGTRLIHEKEISLEELTTTMFGWSLILLICLLISTILFQQQKSKNDDIAKEILKREKLQSELNEIKNQLNPHFLFNSLNSLNSLIRNKSDEASMFVNNLSRLYRYILQSSNKNLVFIKEELEFLKSYTELIQIRYQNKFSIEILIDQNSQYWLIPVLSIQLLVENAIKHNEISSEYPLKIRINIEKEYLIVSHKLRPRRSFVEGTGNGLTNLSKRCEILIGEKMLLSKGELFTVSIPIKKI